MEGKSGVSSREMNIKVSQNYTIFFDKFFLGHWFP